MGALWRVVAVGEEERAVAAARGVTSGPVLLVVDYAETRAGLESMLRAVQADPDVLVLLIARSMGEWWDRLVEMAPAAVRQMLSVVRPVRLDTPVAEDVSDSDLARAAVPYFCRALGIPQPGSVQFEFPAIRAPLLVVHAAALVAVLRSRSDPAASLRVVVGEGVLDELLGHEARYWRLTARAAELPGDGPLVKPLVAAAALIGAGSLDEAAELTRRVPDLASIPLDQRRRWARWLYGLYPAGADGRLGSLQPDLLAEVHVVAQLADDQSVARSCLRDLDENQAERALTVLARACAH